MANGKWQMAKLGRVGLIGLITACACIALLTACTTTRVVTPVTDPYDPNVTKLITNSVSTLDTNLTIGIIEATVPPTVRLVCEKDNNARAYFLQASLVLNAAATSGSYDIATITNSLSKISIRELRTQNAVIAEEAALAIYKAFFAQVVSKQLDREVWVKPVLLALAEAIKSGAE
jgi:hypothetical protein